MERPGLSRVMETLIVLMLGLAGAVVVASMLGFMEFKLTELIQIFDLQKIVEMTDLGDWP